MKLGLTIKKNIKMLLRSKISTLVLVLGPLLIILLVGISFNSNTFNLNLAVYSDSYSDLSREFIAKLDNESFAITQVGSELECTNTVKEQKTHACVVFPPDLTLDNEGSKIILFHVDQSKINLVYLVMSTLEESFAQVSTDISKGLTEDIITTLFMTKAGLIDSNPMIKDIESKNLLIIKNTKDSSTNLGEIDFDTSGSEASFSVTDIDTELDNLKKDTDEMIEEAIDAINDLDDTSLTGNQSDYLEDIEDAVTDVEGEIDNVHNSTTKKLAALNAKISDSLGKLTDKLEDAGDVSSQAIIKINTAKTNADEIALKSEELNKKIDELISNINNIQITNTDNIVSPITTEINPIVQSDSNLGYLFPSLIVILIMFIGLLLPSTLIVMEKNSRAHFRIFTTPTKPWLYTTATYMTSLILLLVQVLIILVVSQFYFKISFLNSFGILLLSLFIIMSLFILIGMLIGDIFNTEEMSMLASVSVATLLLLTSGIVFPIESMPKYIIEKIKYNPVVSGSEAFRKSILFTSGLDSVKEPLGILLISIIFVIALVFIVKKLGTINIRREKINKKTLENKFNFGERKAKTLPEFIVSIQNMEQKRFQHLLDEDAFKNWIKYINKNIKLAKKVAKANKKQELLDILVNELKNNKK
ncbi:ABC transporter permease [archaeon]|nr:ABC transporter permease [archaeon]MBT5424170.1 ABC transporter permease [archaeon]